MNLYEYMGKEIFKKYGIPVPDGYVVSDINEIRPYQYPVAVKSQILSGKRGKSGGIKFAKSQEDLKEAAKTLLGTTINGLKVNKLLIERMINIKKELYLSITLDRSSKGPLLMASPDGGMDIESVPDSRIIKIKIDPLMGYSDYISREVSEFLGLSGSLKSQLGTLIGLLYNAFKKEDSLLMEINPLIIDSSDNIIAGDSKVIIDDSSLYRHKEYIFPDPEKTELENESASKSFTFIEMDGDIGVIANGAGLTMATLDALTLHKLRPRNFLDLGGTDSTGIVEDAFSFVLRADPKIFFVNIFGGVTKADTVANGIVAAKNKFNIKQKIVVRLSGVHEDEGRRILMDNGIDAYSNMNDAINELVKLNGGN